MKSKPYERVVIKIVPFRLHNRFMFEITIFGCETTQCT
jgi:hypothetical protein